MAAGKSGGGSKPSGGGARLERQARELRANLARRKEQSRARSARRPKPPKPTDEDDNGA